MTNKYSRILHKNLIVFVVLSALNLQAQIAVTVSNPNNATPALSSSYPSFAAAVTALNASSSITGPLVLNLTSGSSEVAPAGGFIIQSLSGTSATNSITIQKSGAGNNPILFASPNNTAGSRNDGILKLVGTDFVTIDGLTLQESSGNTVYTLASNTATEFGIALLYASTSNGCKNITIRNSNINLNRSYQNSVGIYANVRHTANTPQTTADIVSVAGAHENISITSNAISNVALPISIVGSTSAANMVSGITIGGSQGNGNQISDFGNNTVLNAGYISVSGSIFGIYVNNYLGVNISHNTLQSANLQTTSTVRGIYLDYTGTPTGTFTNQISNNTLTLTNSSSATIFRGIETNGANSLSTVNATNNTIQNCTFFGAFTAITNSGTYGTINFSDNLFRGMSQTGTSGTFTCISNAGNVTQAVNFNNNQLGDNTSGLLSYSGANSGLLTLITNAAGANTANISISNNTFRGISYTSVTTGNVTLISNAAPHLNQVYENNEFINLSLNTSASVTFLGLSSAVPANGSATVRNNKITTGFSKTAAGGTVTFILATGSSQAGAALNYHNNEFTNVTVTGGTIVTAINNSEGTTANKNIYNNLISGITIGTSNFTGINIANGGSAGDVGNRIYNNTISGINGSTTSSSTINGINIASSANNNAVYNNVISQFNVNTSGTVNGINTSSAATAAIYKNKIFDISNSNSSGNISGINIAGGSTHNVYNNKVGDLRMPSANSANALFGINVTGGSVSNIYFNSIYLNAQSIGATFGSAAFRMSTTPNVTLSNNILVNLSTPNGSTGRTMGVFRAGTALTNFNLQSNNNLIYCGTPSTSRVIFSDGSNHDLALASYQARVAPRESNSVTELPNFLSIVGSASNFLSINPALPSLSESGAYTIALVSDDFDGDVRQGNAGYSGTGTAPDIGADEFETLPPACDGTPTAGFISSNTNDPICGTASRILTLNNASENSGITYQWKWATASGGPYTNTGGTTLTETTGDFSASRFYICEVTCTNSGQTSITPEFALIVNPLPVASFTYMQPDNSGTVNFSNTGTPNANYQWNFGTNTSTEANPTFVFPGMGVYPVSLTVTNACGTVTTTQDVNVIIASIENADMFKGFVIAPNPTQHTLQLIVPESFNSSLVMSVVSIDGKIVWNQRSPFIQGTVFIPVEQLESGIYLFMLENESSKKIIRWVKY